MKTAKQRKKAFRDGDLVLAVKLFRSKLVSAGRAAKVAGLSKHAFIEQLGLAGIPAVDYPSAELDREMVLLADKPSSIIEALISMPDVGVDEDFERR